MVYYKLFNMSYKSNMEKIKKECNELLDFIKVHKTSFILTIFFTFIIYGIKLFNYSISIDTEVIISNYKYLLNSWYGIGRFSLGFLKFILGLTPFNYYLSNVLMILFFAISSFGLYYCLNLVNPTKNSSKLEELKIFLFTALIISSPIFAEQFNFTLQCAEVAISLFILDIGVYFFIKSIQSKNIFLLVIPIICFTENFGCYQAFAPVIIAILVEILILLNKNYNYSIKENAIFILKAFFVGVISLIGYFVIGKLVLHFFNLPRGTYLKDQILWLSEPIKNVILNILNYVKVIIEGNSTFYNHLYLIAIILTFITIIKNYKKVFCNLLSIILLLTPFIFSVLIGNGLIVRMQLVLPIILAIIIIYNTNFKNNYFNYILYIIIFAFIFSQTKTTLNLFESDYARYTQDKTFADSIMEKISPLIDDENTTKIVFVGQRQQSGPSVHTAGETFGASFFFWDYLAPYGMSNRAIGFINTLGHHFQTITAEEFEMAKKVANEKNLASFPQNNSFCKYNNYIIIRLSN